MSAAARKLKFLRDLQARHGGRIPFAHWMEAALYDPEFGYYTSTIRAIGPRGDFTTWPLRDRNLARAIATWARAHRPTGPWHLIEVGPGTGLLAQEVLRALGWWKRPRLHLVEVSPTLRAAQQKRLGRRATWHTRMEEALAACGGQAVIYTNELVDAFPARVFQKGSTGWQELALRIVAGRVQEVWIDPRPGLPESTAFATDWPVGQRIEVQESHQRWREAWDPHWKAGALLTIDYGDTCPALYHRRPRGTLRAFAHHQRMEGAAAYDAFGLRDLTVDVNFSDLLARSRDPDPRLQTLENFLQKHLPPTEAGSPAGFPEAGEAFKVLAEIRSATGKKEIPCTGEDHI